MVIEFFWSPNFLIALNFSYIMWLCILNSLSFLHVQLQLFLTISELHFEEWEAPCTIFYYCCDSQNNRKMNHVEQSS
jgi:hypothetical protein